MFYHGDVRVFESRKHIWLFYTPNFTITMKKFFALCSMIIALGFVAAGCGGGNPAPAPTTPPAVDGTEEETAPAAVDTENAESAADAESSAE